MIFMFELTAEEVEKLSGAKFHLESKERFNIKYKPYVFTEQGVYMLMTVLHGDLAIKQSRALVKTFKENERLYFRKSRSDWSARNASVKYGDGQ